MNVNVFFWCVSSLGSKFHFVIFTNCEVSGLDGELSLSRPHVRRWGSLVFFGFPRDPWISRISIACMAARWVCSTQDGLDRMGLNLGGDGEEDNKVALVLFMVAWLKWLPSITHSRGTGGWSLSGRKWPCQKGLSRIFPMGLSHKSIRLNAFRCGHDVA